MADEDIWNPLGEQKWRELAEGTGASELQLKFAAARFGGASATEAAKLAGYAGDSDSLRRAGYSAVRSTAVQNLLELAAINAPGDAKISDKEIDAKVARLIRSGDPNVVIKAAETAFQTGGGAEGSRKQRARTAARIGSAKRGSLFVGLRSTPCCGNASGNYSEVGAAPKLRGLTAVRRTRTKHQSRISGSLAAHSQFTG